MGDKMPFWTTCPNGHEVRTAHTEEEWREKIESATLQLFCYTCSDPWMLSNKQIADIRRWLDRDPNEGPVIH